MNTICLPALAVLLLAGVPEQKSAEPRGVAEKILGTWNIVAGEKEGKKEPAERLRGREVRITRDRIVVTNKDASKTFTATYKLGLKTKPYAIVMKALGGNDKGLAAQGIFRLEGDRLTICYALPGTRAPDQFRTAPGDRRLLFVLQRAK
jgi:uncharacterized protein (TIGR03067 family)